jgi:creatinine amidohydrolase
MTDLAKRTWPEAEELFVPGTVAILPIGSTEPHGPHLPLDTDVTIALAQSRRAAERLASEGVRAVVLPALAYGLTRFTDGFAGAVSLRPGTLWAVLEDVVCSLEDQGIQHVVFSNGHLEPEHVAVLRGVLLDHAECAPGKAQVAFADNTRRRWAQTLGEEFASGECHAGRYESSIVMAADETAVRTAEREALPAIEIDLLAKMKAGAKSFKEAGAENAYCGDPAQASAEEGLELVERLADVIVGTVRETWPELFE